VHEYDLRKATACPATRSSQQGMINYLTRTTVLYLLDLSLDQPEQFLMQLMIFGLVVDSGYMGQLGNRSEPIFENTYEFVTFSKHDELDHGGVGFSLRQLC
jgi:hypothetical protein